MIPSPQAARASPAAAWRREVELCFVNRPISFSLLALSNKLGDVVWVPGIGRVVNDAEVARAILHDGKRFNSTDPGSFGHMVTRVLGPRALINMDGPEHRALKHHLTEVFSPRYIDEVIDDAAGELVDGLRRDLLTGRTVDFAAFMRHYGGAMACALVGVRRDPADRAATYDEVFRLASDIMSHIGLATRELSPANLARARADARRLSSYVRDGYERGDATARSVTGRLRARGLSFDEIEGLVSVIMVGATELVTYGLPRILAVMIDSGALPRVAAAPRLLDQAIDEGYRVVAPSNIVLRAVAADCEIAGHDFHRGERVLISLRNVMRQRKHFTDPGLFDLERVLPTNLRRLPFGVGPHNCLGTGLALAETRHVLGSLLDLAGRLTITRRGRHRGMLYPGYSELLIRLEAGDAMAT